MLLFFVFWSCGENDKKVKDLDLPLSLRNTNVEINFENLSQAMESYWFCAEENYTLPVVCGCDCNSINEIPNIWETCSSSLDEIMTFSAIESEDCESLKMMYRQSCDHTTLSSFYDELETLIDNPDIDFISSDEKILLKKMLEDLENGLQLDPISLRGDWYDLSDSEHDNNFSLIVIEVTNSLIDFHENNASFFGPSQSDPEVQAFKIGSILGGAVINVIIDVGWDIIEHSEDANYEVTTTDDLIESATKGAIAGAFF